MTHFPVRLVLLAALLPLLSGCLAKTALDTAVGVATLPVKIASRTVDLATTSQAEADQKRGREVRQREERLGKLERDYRKQSQACSEGDAGACRKRDATYAEMQALLPGAPLEP